MRFYNTKHIETNPVRIEIMIIDKIIYTKFQKATNDLFSKPSLCSSNRRHILNAIFNDFENARKKDSIQH